MRKNRIRVLAGDSSVEMTPYDLTKDELTTDISKSLILGSGSSARKELLISAGLIPYKIEIPNVDEGIKPNERPLNVRRIAALKGMLYPLKKDILITADTTVNVGRKVLLKHLMN